MVPLPRVTSPFRHGHVVRASPIVLAVPAAPVVCATPVIPLVVSIGLIICAAPIGTLVVGQLSVYDPSLLDTNHLVIRPPPPSYIVQSHLCITALVLRISGVRTVVVRPQCSFAASFIAQTGTFRLQLPDCPPITIKAYKTGVKTFQERHKPDITASRLGRTGILLYYSCIIAFRI